MRNVSHRPIVLAAGLLLFLCAAPGRGEDDPPTLPRLEALIEARTAELDAAFAQLMDADREGLGHHLLRRLQISASYGRGLTVQDDLTVVPTVVVDRSLKTQAVWSVSYKTSLGELFGTSKRADRRIARAKHRQNVLAERIKLEELHNEFLHRKARFGRTAQQAVAAGAGDDPLEQAYEMRELALRLLLLAGEEDSPAFAEWRRYQPGSPAPGPRMAER
ncbi:MAG: hypothetical protein D6696_02510 [Acidobacteria bacterium]|nr:MAG: hypothetical protein D6696_02510 [Acidobacteriota bacterium]